MKKIIYVVYYTLKKTKEKDEQLTQNNLKMLISELSLLYYHFKSYFKQDLT